MDLTQTQGALHSYLDKYLLGVSILYSRLQETYNETAICIHNKCMSWQGHMYVDIDRYT